MSKRTLTALLLIAPFPLQAAEEGTAEALYQTHCLACHGDEVYTRADRMVTSRDGLERQVRRCELALGLKWFEEEITDMADYLNRTYYRFEP